VALNELEFWAVERIRLLRGLEKERGALGNDVKPSAREQHMARAARKLWSDHLQGDSAQETVARDRASHFIVRLAHCRSEDLRRWFLEEETELFRARFSQLGPLEQIELIGEHALKGTRPLSEEDFQRLRPGLIQVLQPRSFEEGVREIVDDLQQQRMGAQSFKRVPFESVPDQVGSLRVLLDGGDAVICQRLLAPLMVSEFRQRLSRAMAKTARQWPVMEQGRERDRLGPIVKGLSKQYLGPDFLQALEDGGDVDALSLRELSAAAEQSMPLCMRNNFRTQTDRRMRHLRHEARFQLGLFLKGAGLSLEDAMEFWRDSMANSTPAITGNEFNKEFDYHVKHSYGKKGARKDYTPRSCMSIIPKGAGNDPLCNGGCPYQTFSEQALRTQFNQLRIPAYKQDGILEKVKGQHYQLACGSCFEATQGSPLMQGVSHPNEYFRESRKLRLGGEEATEEALPPKTPGPAGARPPPPRTPNPATPMET
jgi:DNA primase large subunit